MINSLCLRFLREYSYRIMWLLNRLRLLRNRMRNVHLTFILVLSLMMFAWILAIRSLFNQSFRFGPSFFSGTAVWEVRSVLLVHTEGCNVTTVDVSPRRLESTSPRCSTTPPRSASNATTLWLRNPKTDRCCFRALQPAGDRFGEDCVHLPEEGFNVLNEKKIGPEVVSVRCENSQEKDFHAFVPLRTDLLRGTNMKVSVLWLSFSGLSTTSLPRLLSRTWNFLRRSLGGIHIKGYSKVHNATLPSMCTAVTGLDEEAYRLRCTSLPLGESPRTRCPWAWLFFELNGYTTMLLEDWPQTGLLQKANPRYSPTRFFDAVHRDLDTSSSADCLGSRSRSQFVAEYLTNFGLTMASGNVPYFAVVWSHALRTNLTTAGHVDATFADALQSLRSAGALRDAVVVLTTEPKDQELPALVVAPPDWFRERFPVQHQRLRTNQERLTTPRDLYATLADIVYPPVVSLDDFRGFEFLNGVSLLQLISPLRNCKDAGIDAEACPCYGGTTTTTSPYQRNGELFGKKLNINY